MNTTHPELIHHTSGLRAPLGFALVTLLIFGLLYSLAGAGLGRVVFPHQATGSMIERDGTPVGSALIPQPFVADGYFTARPSGPGYDPMAAAGSNLARTNPELHKRIEETRAVVAARESIEPAAVPIELITQSGGGLDPHITPEGARVQVARVAAARGIGEDAVSALVAAHIEGPQFGILGESRVNVLRLNLALDATR